jgi:hypothetical protein
VQVKKKESEFDKIYKAITIKTTSEAEEVVKTLTNEHVYQRRAVCVPTDACQWGVSFELQKNSLSTRLVKKNTGSPTKWKPYGPATLGFHYPYPAKLSAVVSGFLLLLGRAAQIEIDLRNRDRVCRALGWLVSNQVDVVPNPYEED